MPIYSEYTPNLACNNDGNGYGLVNNSIGLLTYDEIVLAGNYPRSRTSNYLLKDIWYWTMSPAGFYGKLNRNQIWFFDTADEIRSLSYFKYTSLSSDGKFYPVINLKADVTVTGSGTESDPYVVQ